MHSQRSAALTGRSQVTSSETPPPGRTQRLTQPGDATGMSQRNNSRATASGPCLSDAQEVKDKWSGWWTLRDLGLAVCWGALSCLVAAQRPVRKKATLRAAPQRNRTLPLLSFLSFFFPSLRPACLSPTTPEDQTLSDASTPIPRS